MTTDVKSIVFHPEVSSFHYLPEVLESPGVRTNTACFMQWHQSLNGKKNCSIKSLEPRCKWCGATCFVTQCYKLHRFNALKYEVFISELYLKFKLLNFHHYLHLMAYFVHDDFSSPFLLISQLLPVHPNTDTGLSHFVPASCINRFTLICLIRKILSSYSNCFSPLLCRGEHDVLYG